MPTWLPARIRLQLGPNSQLCPFLNPLSNKISKKSSQIQTLNSQMIIQSGESTKRPTCPSCSRPARTCLCNRLQAPALDNSVAITILQHSLEKKHPLNSTRIATLGFRNVDVITVSDVNFRVRFFIRSLSIDWVELDDAHHVFDEMPREDDDEFVESGTRDCDFDFDFDGQVTGRSDFSDAKRRRSTTIEFTVGKYGAISSLINRSESREMSFDELLALDVTVGNIRKGFVVKRIQMKPLEGTDENYQETEEYEIVIRPGSALLFPSENSVGVDGVNFEVKNLIVLDGTWAKAKRMYNENPWLRLLPHVRLDSDKLSLYGEVRREPNAGYLSTIESIVYAMKALGDRDNSEGLDGLLDVFASMVADQRRCKNERLSKA